MKNIYLLTLCALFLVSCSKTAKDIKVDEINTPCEWLTAYEITVVEYHDYIIKNLKNYDRTSDTSLGINPRFEKKRVFYDKLLMDIISLPNRSKAIDMGDYRNCKSNLTRVQLDEMYRVIYDSLLPLLSPSYVAEAYLQALKDQDYDRANFLSLPDRNTYHDILKERNWDAGLPEIKDVNCIIQNKAASCTFCCATDTFWKEIKLFYFKGRWYNSPPKEEIPPPEDISEH